MDRLKIPVEWRLAVAALMLTACAAPETSSGSPSAATTGDASAPSQQTPVASEDSEPIPNIIGWILDLGPGAPKGPPEFTAYSLLRGVDAQGQQVGLVEGCESLLAGLEPGGDLPLSDAAQTLYAGAAHACLGALGSGEGHWSAAAQALSSLSPPQSCMDAAAYDLLQRLVRKHEMNPAGTFRPRTEGPRAKRPPCPQVLAITPAAGPRLTTVTLTGTDLNRVLDVVLYFEDADEDPDEAQWSEFWQFEHRDGDIVLTVDDSTNTADWACVVVQGAPGWNGAGARFTFVELELSPAPSSADTPAPQPTPIAECPPPSIE